MEFCSNEAISLKLRTARKSWDMYSDAMFQRFVKGCIADNKPNESTETLTG